jgi:hypothetical protein
MHSCGCVRFGNASLWPSEDSCDVGDEREILNHWDLEAIEYEQLIETGPADRED